MGVGAHMNGETRLNSEGRWVVHRDEFRLLLGGLTVVHRRLNTLTLNVPFTHVTTELSDAGPPPLSMFKNGIEAAVIPAYPIDGKSPDQVKFLPQFVRYTSTSLRYWINLRCTFSEYVRGLPSKMRKNLNGCRRRFTEFSEGEIRWQEYRSTDKAREFYDLASEISHKSWHERVGGPGFPGSINKKRVEDLAASDSMRGYVLFHGLRPVAFAYCEIHSDTVAYIKPAYDEEYGKHSPGIVLLGLLLEALFAEGKYRCFDFGDGDQWYKRQLATDQTLCAYMLYFPKTVANTFCVLAKVGLDRFSRNIGKLLKTVGVKNRLKRFLKGERQRGPVEAG